MKLERKGPRTRKHPRAKSKSNKEKRGQSSAEHQARPRGRRRKSRHSPGAAYKPTDEHISGMQSTVLEWLRDAGPAGITKLELPPGLILGWGARITELRDKGYVIITVPDTEKPVGRYVLISEPVAADDSSAA